MKSEVELRERPEQPRTNSSDVVRDFYERMPYPAPVGSLDKHRELYRNPDRRRALFHLVWPAERPRANREILIAGCGTSQAARYALCESDCRITAIDVSQASLHHTRELKQKYGLDNLELCQLSILNVHELGRTFDQIVCTGVLHHLTDPDLGLLSLRNVLKHEGAMQIMVYAKYGRTGIYMMQAYCHMLGITASIQELQDLGGALNGLPRDHPLTRLLNTAKDFQHPDALADALLHPQDCPFTVPRVYEWLEKCGMSFGRWIEQAPYLPQCGVVARTPHAARMASLPPPLQHAAVELFRGTMVSHSFTAYRDDRAGESQPISFAGGRWREYVPITLPWTVRVQEKLPPGSVAVLINPAHRFNDLFLPVNSFENQLLSAIDGKRTLAEILAFAVPEGNDERKALSFFERLWQYDHIVFDASRTSDHSFEEKSGTTYN